MINLSTRGDVLVWLGDSITAQQWFLALQTTLAGLSSKSVFFNSGVSGDTVELLNTGYATRVGKYGPTIVFIHIGINNLAGWPTTGVDAATDPATFQADYQTLINTIKADFPKCKIVLTTLLVYGENWGSGTGTPNPRDTTLEDYCTRIRTLASTNGCELVEWRGTVYAVQEPNYNPGHASQLVLYDSVGSFCLHPQATCKGLMCTEAATHFQVDPAYVGGANHAGGMSGHPAPAVRFY